MRLMNLAACRSTCFRRETVVLLSSVSSLLCSYKVPPYKLVRSMVSLFCLNAIFFVKVQSPLLNVTINVTKLPFLNL